MGSERDHQPMSLSIRQGVGEVLKLAGHHAGVGRHATSEQHGHRRALDGPVHLRLNGHLNPAAFSAGGLHVRQRQPGPAGCARPAGRQPISRCSKIFPNQGEVASAVPCGGLQRQLRRHFHPGQPAAADSSGAAALLLTRHPECPDAGGRGWNRITIGIARVKGADAACGNGRAAKCRSGSILEVL